MNLASAPAPLPGPAKTCRPHRLRRAAVVLVVLLGCAIGVPATAHAATPDDCTWRATAQDLARSLANQTAQTAQKLQQILQAAGITTDSPASPDCSGSQPAAGSSPDTTPSGDTSTSGSAPAGVTGAGGGGAGTGNYVFDDEFNNNTLDTSAWAVLDRGGDASNNESQCYKPSNVIETGGYLQITSKVDSCNSGYKYSSGMVQWRTFNLTYGTIEIRAKQSGGQGSWPAQWLLGADCQAANQGTVENTGGCNWPNPGSDEVDIAEFKSDGPSVDWQNVVSGNSGFKTCKPSVADASQNWHVYSFTWSTSSLVWKIDGKTTCTQSEVVPTKPMFLIMNNAMGGSGGAISDSAFPQTMLVDYVRVSGA